MYKMSDEMVSVFLKRIEPALTKALMDLIEIPSVRGPMRDGMPFGEDVGKALEYVLSMADNMGLETNDMDGYIGEVIARSAEANNTDIDSTIGILCHVDVVDGGEGWNTDPFKPDIIDGKIYGRGSIDDKGPLICSLFAMEYLKKNDLIPLGKELKLIIGTNEEEDWECIDYYVENSKKLPDYSIVPDANFPLINCEKGLLNFDLIAEGIVEPRLLSLVGGSARNVVPGKASCEVVVDIKEMKDEILKLSESNDDIQIKIQEDGEKYILAINAKGKSTHCMSPEKGLNAIACLMEFLKTINDTFIVFDDDFSEYLETFSTYFGVDYYGEKLGVNLEDEESGLLTFNIGVIKYEGANVIVEADVRYPASFEYETVDSLIRKNILKTNWKYQFTDHIPPVYHSKDSDLVTTLMDVYRKISEDYDNEPLSIGGATYARALPNAIAFGPLFPYEEELAHEANEFITIDSLIKSTHIYIEALMGMLNLK